MRRLRWPLAVVAAFAAGWAMAGVTGKTPASRDADRDAEQLRQQVTTLQARLHAREEIAGEPASAAPTASAARRAAVRMDTGLTAAAREERMLQDLRARGAPPPASARAATSGPPPTLETALERFYRYLDATRGGEGRERWQRARELVDELRAMGDVAGKALMQVLATGSDSDERRAAARLLGSLQVPQSLPLLKDIIEKDDDLLLRRAAAAGLRQLQTPDSVPVMEHILLNGADDRFVRLSAAYGLAEAGRPLGVNGLAQIFNESAADGRGREMAFRALSSLNDERSVPFMRQVMAADVEPGFRLRAIQYLTAQGDRQALPSLQILMKSPSEQPSIRDAAAQAFRALGGK
jgi:HEAT repeat protein